MALNKKLLHSTILAGVSALAIAAFAQDAQATVVVTGGTGSVLTASGVSNDGTDDIVTNQAGGEAPPSTINIATGATVSNSGAQANAALGGGANQSVIYLNNGASAVTNRLILQGTSVVDSTGGTGSAVLVSSLANDADFQGITVGADGIIRKTGGATGNAINATAALTINNAGLITASSGDGTIVSNAALTLTSTGNITNTGNHDAIRVTGAGAVSLTFDGATANVSSLADHRAIDLSGATATGQLVVFNNGAGSSEGGILLGGSAGTSELRFTGDGDSVIRKTGDAGSRPVVRGVGAADTTITINKTSGTVTLDGDIEYVDTVNIEAGNLTLTGGQILFSSNNYNVLGAGILTFGAANYGGSDSITVDLRGNESAVVFNREGVMFNVGNLTDSNGGDETQRVTVTSGTVNGNIDLGEGSDYVTVNGGTLGVGEDDTVALGDGDDFLVVSSGTLGAIVNAGAGVDTFTISGGTINSYAVLNAGDGADIFNISGGVINSVINGDAGDDVITISGTAQINAAVNGGADADTINVSGGTISATGSLNGGAGADTFNISGGTIAGTVNGDAGADILNISGGAISGAINTGADNDVINYSGGTFTGGINMGANGTDTFNVTGNGVSTGSTIDGVDVLSIGANNTFTVNHNINANTNGAGDLDLAAGSRLIAAGGNVIVGGNVDFVAASTLQINKGRTVTATALSHPANGTVVIGFDGATAGKLILTGAANMAGVNLQPLAEAGVDFSSGSRSYVIVDGAAGNATLFSSIIDTNSLFTYTQSADNVNGDIVLHIARQNQIQQIVPQGGNEAAAGISVEQLLTLNTSTPPADRDPVVVAFAARLTTSSDTQIAEIMQTVVPTVDLGGVMASMNVTNQTHSQVNTRIADLRLGNDVTGMAAGNGATDYAGASVWVQGFGSTAGQDRRGGIAGFDADTFGGTVGADVSMTDSLLLGLALSYANTDIDSKNANRTDTEVDSYQLTAYGSYGWSNGTYLNGYMSYSYNDIEQQRHNVGILGNTASADYSSDQFDIRAELGHDFKDVLNTRGLVFIPQLSAQYTNVETEIYSEKGAGGLGLKNVDIDTLHALEFGADFTLAYDYQTVNGGILTPSVNVGYAYEALGEELQTSASFIGGGAAFTAQGYDPAQHSVNGGLGLIYSAPNNWDFSADYDYKYKSDYDSHTGIIKAKHYF